MLARPPSRLRHSVTVRPSAADPSHLIMKVRNSSSVTLCSQSLDSRSSSDARTDSVATDSVAEDHSDAPPTSAAVAAAVAAATGDAFSRQHVADYTRAFSPEHLRRETTVSVAFRQAAAAHFIQDLRFMLEETPQRDFNLFSDTHHHLTGMFGSYDAMAKLFEQLPPLGWFIYRDVNQRSLPTASPEEYVRSLLMPSICAAHCRTLRSGCASSPIHSTSCPHT